MRENLHKAPRIWGQIGRTFEARSRLSCLVVAASGTAFDEAVEYTLGELQLSHLKLKDKQVAVLLEHVYKTERTCSAGLRKSILYRVQIFIIRWLAND